MDPITEPERALYNIFIQKVGVSKYETQFPYLNYFIQSGELVPTTTDMYTLKDFSRLRIYAEELKSNYQYNRAQKAIQICDASTPENLDRIKKVLVEAVLSRKDITSHRTKEIGLSKIELRIAKMWGFLEQLYYSYLIPKSSCFMEYAKILQDDNEHAKAKFCLDVMDVLNRDKGELEDDARKIYKLYFRLGGLSKDTFFEDRLDYFICISMVRKGLLIREKASMFPCDKNLLLEIAQKFENEGKIDKMIESYRLLNKVDFDADMTSVVMFKMLEFGQTELLLSTIKPLIKNQDFKHLYYFYFFLLCFLIDTRLELQHKISLSDMINPNEKDKVFEEQFKKAIYDQKFNTAIKMLKQKPNNIQTKITRKMLLKIVKRQQETRRQVQEYIDTDRPIDLFLFLRKERSFRPLSKHLEIIFYIARDIYEKEVDNKDPVCIKPRSGTLSELIRFRAYPMAFQKWSVLCAQKDVNPEDDYLGKMLKMACHYLFLEQKHVEEKEKSKDHLKYSSTFTDFLNLLRDDQKETAKKLAMDLLSSNSKSDYGYIVDAMIDISILDGDKDYVRAVGMLVKLIKGSVFDPPKSNFIDISGLLNDIAFYSRSSSLEIVEKFINLIDEIYAHGHTNLTREELINLTIQYRNQLAKNAKKQT